MKYFLITALFIGLWFFLVDFNKLTYFADKINWVLIFLGTLAGLIQSYFASVRLKILLSWPNNLSTPYLMSLSYLVGLANLFLHISGGGFLMSYYIKKRLNKPFVKIFGILLIDFLMGVIFTLILALVGIIYLSSQQSLLINNNLTIILAIILLAIAVFLTVIGISYKIKVLKHLSLALISKKSLVQAVFLTILISSISLLNFYLFFMAFGISPPIWKFVFASSAFFSLNMIPGVFAKFGQQELFGLLTLPVLLNLDPNQVFPVILLNHLVSVTVILIGGWVSLLSLKLSIDKLSLILNKTHET